MALIDAAALAPPVVSAGSFLATGGGVSLLLLLSVRLLTRTVEPA